MKDFFVKVKNNLLVISLLFIIVFFLVGLILRIFSLRFRSMVTILVLIIFGLLFILGIVKNIIIGVKEKNDGKCLKFALIGFLGLLIDVFLIFFSYNPEKIVILDKKYVEVSPMFECVDASYYDSYFILMGTKERVHAYFNDGVCASRNYSNVRYIYYDKKGNVRFEELVHIKRDLNNNIVSKNIKVIYDSKGNEYNFGDINNDFSDKSYSPVLSKDLEVLYEEKFDDIVLRFVRYDYVLGQRSLVGVVKSPNGGKDFFIASKDPIQVSNEAKFVFLNENLGFAINTGRQELWQEMTGMYVTQDGGKSFVDVKFDYHKEDVEAIKLRNLPYYDNGVLKLNTLVYDVNPETGERENIPLFFVSNDNGINWEVSD